MKLFTKPWWEAARDRAAKSAAQGFLLSIPPSTAGFMGADWRLIAYMTVGMGLVSLATSIVMPPPEIR